MSREEHILRAAERLFDERGYAGVGVDAIGLEAGVSGSAIYRHFSGKDELLATLFDRAIDALLLRAGTVHQVPGEDLEHLIEVHVSFALENPRLATIWAREERSLSDTSRRIYQRKQRMYLDRWDQALRRCYPHRGDDELVTVRHGLLSLLMSSAAVPGRRNQPPSPSRATLQSMAQASLAALAPKATPP